jgi:hypothetical protein
MASTELPERQLEVCYDLQAFATPYSNDARSLPYSGIMFDLFSKAEPLEILTIEFDVRNSAVTDYSVEVFTTDGAYASKISDRSLWRRVANAEAVPSPDGSGVIIPQRVFENIQLGARERLSMYIQMKGPWIENRAEALTKTGELANEGLDFFSYAGIGLNSRFPTTFDTTTDPQFSGRVYYQQSKACEDTTETVIDVQFVGSAAPDSNTLTTMSTSVKNVVEQYVLAEEWFAGMASSSGLSISGTPKTTSGSYNGECPWSACASFTTALTFSHKSSLSPGELRYEFYRYVDGITREAKALLKTEELAYLGLKSASAGFSLTFTGVTEGESMSPEHENFLESAMVNFFQDSIQRSSNFVTVFDSEITADNVLRKVRNLRMLDGAIQIEGSFFGARSAPLDKEEFVVQLQSSLRNEEDILVQSLRYGSITPQPDLPPESVLLYFNNVVAVSGTFSAGPSVDADWVEIVDPGDDVVDGGGNGGGNDSGDSIIPGDDIKDLTDDASNSPTFLLVAAALGGMIILSIVLYFGCAYCKRKKYKQDLHLYRKSMKVERKIRRLSRDDDDVLRKDALKALKELDEEDGASPKTTSSKSDSDDAPPESARPATSLNRSSHRSNTSSDSNFSDEDTGKRRKSKKDANSLPDAESLRRSKRSYSHERASSKHTRLGSFMEEEDVKKKPPSKTSSSQSFAGFDRSAPSRSSSSNSGSGHDRRTPSRARSSDELERLRSDLQRRNNQVSPKMNDVRQSRSHHTRSFSGDLDPLGAGRSSKSAHSRPMSGDAEGGLYGSAAPRRGTRSQHVRSQSPSRSHHARSSSGDLQNMASPRRSTASPNGRAPPGRSQSSDRQPTRAPSPRTTGVRQSKSSSGASSDLASMRRSMADTGSRSSHARASDEVRRGRKRTEGLSSVTEEAGSSHARGVRRNASSDGLPPSGAPPPRGQPPRRSNSGG